MVYCKYEEPMYILQHVYIVLETEWFERKRRREREREKERERMRLAADEKVEPREMTF